MESPPLDTARLAGDLNLKQRQVEQTLSLLDAGNTVAFITRYRKEATGNLDEEQIRAIERLAAAHRQLNDRAATIARLIDEQGRLTPELQTQIQHAPSLQALEDLYLPFRPRRRTRAEAARERGVEPLANLVWNARPQSDLQPALARAVDPQQGLPDNDAVIAGIVDILAERISEQPAIRDDLRKTAWKTGSLRSKVIDPDHHAAQPFRDYFDYRESLRKIPPHRVLALNRGESENALRIRIEWDDQRVMRSMAQQLHQAFRAHEDLMQRAAREALSRFLRPAIHREIRKSLTERAESHAIEVFAKNLRNLLLQPPVVERRVLAIDPGLRTGCKVVILDEYGQPLLDDVVFVTGSQDRRQAARERLAQLLKQHACSLIALGNGTGCREAEDVVTQVIADNETQTRYVIVNEAGASIYSASTAAREEFPELDATVRGTLSIGRRLQDPLSELVKIEPQHLGVGMYQHDVNEKRLIESLETVVESSVNFVGVDLNRASSALLQRVSGFNQLIARRVVAWRDQHGPFARRAELLKVPGIGERVFQQSAGFLKIAGGDEPLDATWIHPESYPAARTLLHRIGVLPEQAGRELPTQASERLNALDRESLADELSIGTATLHDMINDLLRPPRDPRSDFPGPMFKRSVLSLDDLEAGMELSGTVLNVVDFGAFVDVGLKSSGLVHISRMSDRFVSNPHDIVAIGDLLTVWVEEVDHDRGRVSLTMLAPDGTTSSTDATPPDAPPPARAKTPRRRARKKSTSSESQ